jgi:hypothetical protein
MDIMVDAKQSKKHSLSLTIEEQRNSLFLHGPIEATIMNGILFVVRAKKL